MKKISNFSFFIFLLFTTITNNILRAQDQHLLQYNASPLNLNPAQTGLFNGDFRLVGNYRNQWAAISGLPYKTFSFSADTKLSNLNLKNGREQASFPAIGLLLNSDQSADAILKTNQVALSLAYHLKLASAGKSFLTFGIQPGITNRVLDMTGLTTDIQYDPASYQYNSAKYSGENLSSRSVSFFDIGAGVAYSWQKNPRQRVNIGFSGFHLTTPDQSFFSDGSSKLDRKYNLSGIAEFPTGKNFSLLPSFLSSSQGEFKETLLGMFGKYYLTPIEEVPTAISLGAFLRTRDAYSIVAGFEYQNLNIGVSYDINYSNLANATNNRGGFELSVIYIINKFVPYVAKQRACPIFM